MTQIEQIKAEIVRLKSQLVRGACASQIAMETNCKDEAYNEVLAFIDSIPAESCLSECNFKEYLRGVFEANNGIENDPATLAALHGPTLFKLAQKELPDSPDFEAEWKRYTASRKDDMRTNAVTMNVKEVAKHFAEWGEKHILQEGNEKDKAEFLSYCDRKVLDELYRWRFTDVCREFIEQGIFDYACAKHFAEWGAEHLKSNH